jgi:hypothetical protein
MRVALAGPAVELEAEGERLARDKHFLAAIEKFKAAYHAEPHARDMCLVALAYARLEQWSEADLYLQLCHQRSGPNDPLPEWIDDADGQIERGIGAADVARVEIEVTPDDVSPDLRVSTFAGDDPAITRSIHLVPGHHVITASAPGYLEVAVPIDITDRSPRKLAIVLERTAPKPATDHTMDRTTTVRPPVGSAAKQVTASRPRSRVPMVLLATAAALGAAGGGVELTYYRQQHDQLLADEQRTDGKYFRDEPAYDHARELVIGLYLLAGISAITAVVWNESAGRGLIGFAPTTGGGLVTLGWQR